jgi:hypothetical protein
MCRRWLKVVCAQPKQELHTILVQRFGKGASMEESVIFGQQDVCSIKCAL